MHTRKYKLKRKTRSRSRSGGFFDWLKKKFVSNDTGSNNKDSNDTGSNNNDSNDTGSNNKDSWFGPPVIPQGNPVPPIPGKPQQPAAVQQSQVTTPPQQPAAEPVAEIPTATAPEVAPLAAEIHVPATLTPESHAIVSEDTHHPAGVTVVEPE